MSRSPLSTFWSRNPDIPIYLDTSNKSGDICQNCNSNSRDQPIHCISVASPAPSYHTECPPTPPPKNLGVPVLNLETSRCWSRPQPPRPALRFDIRSDAEGRLRVRSRRSTYSPLSPGTLMNDIDFGRKSYSTGSSIPNTPEDDIGHMKRSKAGLGIPEAPFNPDPSPIRSPAGEKLARAEKGELSKKSSPNIAQGIEQKLWNYSASGNVVKRWLLEIVSWSLSACCMVAIIAVLYLFTNKPVPKNWPMGLTLNAYVAILSRIASAALVLPASEALGQLKWSWFQDHSKKMWDFEIFDNASRGPWGSFLLLVRTKGRTLAALGAAITIFAMLLDPFFQQVVHFAPRWDLQPQNSSIPRVIHYAPRFSREEIGGTPSIMPDPNLDAPADKFFLDLGVQPVQVGNGTRAEIPLACPTSNCTWEPYETLGVCSQCVDIVDMLEFGCLPAQLDWVQNASSFTTHKNGTMCGWFFNATSESRMLMLGYEVDPATNRSSGEILTTRLLPLITNIKRRPLFGASINFKHVRNPIADFVVVSAAAGPDRESTMKSVLRNEKPRGFECVLSWCVQTIESSYHLATYTETVKDRFINTTTGPYPWTTVVVKPGPEPVVANRYLQNITVDPHAPGGQGNISSYGVSNQTAFNTIDIFDDHLPSFATTRSNDSKTYLRYKTWHEIPPIREYDVNPWAPPNNLTRHIERLATTMTNVMRMASRDFALGKAFSDETFVEVRWGWLILPVSLLVLTLVFLIATVVRTSREKDRVGVWKNSSIATLLYGLPDEMQRKITASKAKGTPRARAKNLNVRMLPTKDWRISGNLLSPIAHKSKHEPPPGWI